MLNEWNLKSVLTKIREMNETEDSDCHLGIPLLSVVVVQELNIKTNGSEVGGLCCFGMLSGRTSPNWTGSNRQHAGQASRHHAPTTALWHNTSCCSNGFCIAASCSRGQLKQHCLTTGWVYQIQVPLWGSNRHFFCDSAVSAVTSCNRRVLLKWWETFDLLE